MKTKKYKGLFKSVEGNTYELEVSCNGFIEAFFLLTADAIRSGKHYQLNSITDEKGDSRIVGDILKCAELIS